MELYCYKLTTQLLIAIVVATVGTLTALSPPSPGESSKCPKYCRCEDIEQVLNCSDSSLKQIPKKLGPREEYAKLLIERNELTTIVNDTFIKFSNLLLLSLAENKIATVENNSLKDLDKLRKINFSQNNLSLIPWAVLQLLTLLELDLRDNAIYTLRPNDINGLGNLTKLFLDGNFIDSLPDGFLGHTPGLKVFSIARNNLQNISSRVFRCADSLEELYLSENSLRDLPNGWLTGASNLSILDMTRAMYIDNDPDVDIPAYTFPGVAPVLETLILSGNGIREIKPLAFSPLQSLRELDLSQNLLRFLPRGCFSPNLALEYINLRSNKIKSFVEQLFSEGTGLRMVELSLEDNQIENLTREGFANMDKLEILNLASNNILELDSYVFSRLRFLRKLELQDNVLINITYYSFLFLFSIEELYLQNNKLPIVPNVANLSRLTILDLSRNKISYIHPDAFKGTNINKLYLNGNELKTLPISIIDLQLKALYVSKNPWDCDCGIKWMPKTARKAQQTDLDDATCTYPLGMRGTLLKNNNLDSMKCTGAITPTSIVILVSLWFTVLLILVLSVILRQYHKFRVKTRRRGDKSSKDSDTDDAKGGNEYFCDGAELEVKNSNGRVNGMKIKPFEEEFYV
ncbi:podocan-like [Amphiura filiformis]|uniref:podocan-like n=1 Tax=Amphiura filiformis TaxID=82378 RepID=UPI003B22389C